MSNFIPGKLYEIETFPSSNGNEYFAHYVEDIHMDGVSVSRLTSYIKVQNGEKPIVMYVKPEGYYESRAVVLYKDRLLVVRSHTFRKQL